MSEAQISAKKMADWFRKVKREAYIGGGLYRVKMSEADYDGITDIFDMLADGFLVYTPEPPK